MLYLSQIIVRKCRPYKKSSNQLHLLQIFQPPKEISQPVKDYAEKSGGCRETDFPRAPNLTCVQ